MKLSLTQENLAKALNVVGRVVSGRSSLPVLSNVLLSTDANRLKLAATNLELGITYRIGCKVEEEGSITVPARLITELIAGLPGGNIELNTNDLSLQVKTSHQSSSINGISADEFPLIPEIKSKPSLSLPSDTFKDALSQVVVAASPDETRPALAGVYLYTEDNYLTIVATDSYRLAEKKVKLKSKPEKAIEVIVPARTIQELVRALGDAKGGINIYFDDNQVMFETDGIELTSRLIEGKFPNYKQIIPTTTESTIEIDSSEFARITKLASLFARENAGSIKVEIKSEGLIEVASTASEVGESLSTAEGAVSGGTAEVSLNAKFLLDALTATNADEVSFSINGKLNPCILQPVGKEDDYLHIIMPLRT